MTELAVGYRVKERRGQLCEGTVMKVTPKDREVIVLWDDVEEDTLPPGHPLCNVAIKYTPAELQEIAEVIDNTEHPHGFRPGQRFQEFSTQLLIDVKCVEWRGKRYSVTFDVEAIGIKDRRTGVKAMLNLMKIVRYKAR